MTGPVPLSTAALVSLGSDGGKQSLTFQYNPATIKRSIEPQTVGGTSAVRTDTVRFTAAAAETITLDCRFSAAIAMATGSPDAQYGIAPDLAALALLASPSTASVRTAQTLFALGMLEILPPAADTLLLVWGRRTAVPVRLTALEITEELFNSDLYPVQASATVSLRCLTYSDVDIGSHLYQQALGYQQNLESLADRVVSTNGIDS